MSWVTYLGMVAAACTTFSFLPQALKTIKTRNTKDLSLGMYAVLTIGIFLWLVYGLIIWDIPVIAANTVTLFLTITILALKLRYK
ncbi:MAG: SemiSWEET transporter [Chlorobiales bacterium]|nr:SemiSWEET transporter [Chlorobiales bacterium]